MAKTYIPVKGKAKGAEAFKSAQKILKTLGLDKTVKIAMPSGRGAAAVEAAEEEGEKFSIKIESAVTETKAGLVTVWMVAGSDTSLELGKATVKSVGDEQLIKNLKACGLM